MVFNFLETDENHREESYIFLFSNDIPHITETMFPGGSVAFANVLQTNLGYV